MGPSESSNSTVTPDHRTVATVIAASRGSRNLTMVATGVLGGFVLGVIARVWMRLIAEDPAFTWSGTIFIVVGFTVFGLAQSIAAVARRRPMQRWKLTTVRGLSALFALPLFGAAGAVMFPTVLGCGLAVARTDWHRMTRCMWLVVAAGPVLFVGNDLVEDFGWSLHAIAGLALMSAIYGTIIWATRWTLAPQLDGWRMRRGTRRAIVIGVPALIVGLVQLSGGLK